MFSDLLVRANFEHLNTSILEYLKNESIHLYDGSKSAIVKKTVEGAGE